MLAVFSSVTGWPAASDADIFAAPAGSTPTTRTRRRSLLDRRRDAGQSARRRPRARRPSSTSGHCSRISRPTRALAGDDPRMIERRHHRQAARRGFRLGARLPFGRRRPGEDHLGAECPHAVDLDRGAVVGITTTAGDAEAPGRERHRLAVVAGRVGDDAPRRRSSAVSCASMLQAPRILNAPAGCRFSHLRSSGRAGERPTRP